MLLFKSGEDGSSQQGIFFGAAYETVSQAACVTLFQKPEHSRASGLSYSKAFVWSIAGPCGRPLGRHHQGQCPCLGQVSAPTCQLCTPVKSTKLWTQPESAHAALRTMQLGTSHIGINNQEPKKVIWTFCLVQAFLPGSKKKCWRICVLHVNFSEIYFIQWGFQYVNSWTSLCKSPIHHMNLWKHFYC